MRIAASKTPAEGEADTQARRVGLGQSGRYVETFGHESKNLKTVSLTRWVGRPE